MDPDFEPAFMIPLIDSEGTTEISGTDFSAGSVLRSLVPEHHHDGEREAVAYAFHAAGQRASILHQSLQPLSQCPRRTLISSC